MKWNRAINNRLFILLLLYVLLLFLLLLLMLLFVLLSAVAGSAWISQFLSSVISCERCFVIVSPFRAQKYMKTSTMAAIITCVSAVLIGGFTFAHGNRFADGCLFDPVTNTTNDIVYETK